MSREVVVTETAAAHLLTLIKVLSLPTDTSERVRASLARLSEFSTVGVLLPEPYAAHELRFILGPWRWMLIVYQVIEANNQVIVVAIEDARMSTSVTTRTR